MCYLLWENDNLNETYATENKECAGHISSKTIINLFGVLKTENQWEIMFFSSKRGNKTFIWERTLVNYTLNYQPFSQGQGFEKWAETFWHDLSSAGRCFVHQWLVQETHPPHPLGSGPLEYNGYEVDETIGHCVWCVCFWLCMCVFLRELA